MPSVACTIVGEFGPNLVVRVDGRDRSEETPAHPTSLLDPAALAPGSNNRLGVGVAARDGEAVLVEFAQEAFSGAWRAWVPAHAVDLGRAP